MGKTCRSSADGKTIDIEQTKQMVDLFMDAGFTYFDTAYVYNNGESNRLEVRLEIRGCTIPLLKFVERLRRFYGFSTVSYSIIPPLAEVGYYDDAEPHKLLIASDLFDRGREAVELQSFILDLLERDAVIIIRGNHEDLFEELVTVDNGLRYDHHLSNGTYSTALQLTGFDKRHAKISPLAFAQTARETPYYKTILPAMIDYYETSSFIFTHGWIPCAKDGNEGLAYMDN